MGKILFRFCPPSYSLKGEPDKSFGNRNNKLKSRPKSHLLGDLGVKQPKMYKMSKLEIATKSLSHKGFTKYKQSDFLT
jgi:hypothetical protein